MTEPPYLSEYQAGYLYRPDAANGYLPPSPPEAEAVLRKFEDGVIRDSDDQKLDFEGFLSPAVLWAFAEYMHKHRKLPDGSMRGSDNWQGGMPLDVYLKSLLRHVMDLWMLHRGFKPVRPENGEEVSLSDTLGGILFNLQGFWLQTLKGEK